MIQKHITNNNDENKEDHYRNIELKEYSEDYDFSILQAMTFGIDGALEFIYFDKSMILPSIRKEFKILKRNKK